MKTVLLNSAALLTVSAGVALAGSHLMVAPGEGEFNWESYDGFASEHDYSGQQLTIFGPWLGPDAEAIDKVLAYFAEATGADVRYTGSDSFETQIVVDAEAGSAPNVAVFPQPGLASDMAKRGFLTPLGDDAAGWMSKNYAAGDSWVALGSYAGADGSEAFYAFPYKADVKSLVWYVPENFEDFGYEVPETMEEFRALMDQMVADGETPLCVGLGSGGATGWPATDWVEDLMLRVHSPDVYDQWVTNEMPFDDPKVIEVLDLYKELTGADDYVAGNAKDTAAVDFRDSPKGMFDSPPQCMMHRQASFIPAFFPEGTEVGLDADFFYFPAYAEKDLGSPVLGAGTLFAVTNESDAAHGFIDFLQTPIAHELWMSQEGGGFLTPLKTVNTDVYVSDVRKALGDILLNATTFRFDGSDLMPGGVGAGTFWTGMVDYSSGSKDAATVASEIQSSWDALK